MANYNVTEAIRRIKGVNYALENLEVKGSHNMDILLGSMRILEQSINIIEAAFSELNRPVPEPEVKVEVVPEGEEPPTE